MVQITSSLFVLLIFTICSVHGQIDHVFSRRDLLRRMTTRRPSQPAQAPIQQQPDPRGIRFDSSRQNSRPGTVEDSRRYLSPSSSSARPLAAQAATNPSALARGRMFHISAGLDRARNTRPGSTFLTPIQMLKGSNTAGNAKGTKSIATSQQMGRQKGGAVGNPNRMFEVAASPDEPRMRTGKGLSPIAAQQQTDSAASSSSGGSPPVQPHSPNRGLDNSFGKVMDEFADKPVETTTKVAVGALQGGPLGAAVALKDARDSQQAARDKDRQNGIDPGKPGARLGNKFNVPGTPEQHEFVDRLHNAAMGR